jgi:hypothetical protein
MSSLLACPEQHLSVNQTQRILLEKPIQEIVDLYRISLATGPLDTFIAEQNKGNPCTRDRSRELLEHSLAHNLWAIRSVSQVAFRGIDTVDTLLHFDRVLDIFFRENNLRVGNRAKLAQELKDNPLLFAVLRDPASAHFLHLTALKETILGSSTAPFPATSITRLDDSSETADQLASALREIINITRREWREQYCKAKATETVEKVAQELFYLL